MSAESEAVDRLRRSSEALADKLSESTRKKLAEAADIAARNLADNAGSYTAADYDRIYRTYAAALREAALEDAAIQARALVIRLLPDLLVSMGANGAAPSVTVLTALEKTVDYFRVVMSGLPGMAEDYVREVLQTAVTRPISVIDLAAAMKARFTGPLAERAVGFIRTQIQVLDQTVINQVSQDQGYEYGLYAGPDDIVTRPFCDHVVDQVFPLKAFEESDNGQLPNVLISRGGYNCRHRIRPIRLATARGLGFPVHLKYVMKTQEVGSRVIVYPVGA